jgi:hypothetical protein
MGYRVLLPGLAGWFLSTWAVDVAAAEPPAGNPAYRYVVPGTNDPFHHPPLRALAMSDEKPEDLKEEVSYRGKKQRYAQLRYGNPASTRVAIVVDEIAPGEVDLYVDTHRQRAITTKDKVAGDKMTWQLPLEVAMVEGDVLKLTPRKVMFRYGRATRSLSYATCGYVEGQARVGDKLMAVRRVDGDGNGFLTDPQDRLWLDLDGSGRWDPLEHQFPFAPIVTLNKVRYAVKSDPLGKHLALAKVEGTGVIRVAIPKLPGGGAVEDVTLTVLSRDGIVATLQGKDAEMVLPVGEYRCTTLLLTLKEPQNGRFWGYLFSSNGADREEWRPLAKDAVLSLDPVGKVMLTCPVGDDGKCISGAQLQVRPGLYTGDGLLITTAYQGREMPALGLGDGPQAKIFLKPSDGTILDQAASGFA